MSLYLNINFLPNSFPKAVELWELGDFGNGLIQFEQLAKLININKGTSIKVENFAKSQAKDIKKSSYFSTTHYEPSLQHSHQIKFMPLSDWHIDQLIIRGFDELIRAREIWMQQLIEHPYFLMARLMDQDFDEKQNNDSLQMSEIHDWPHEHLPKISNGKPAPLDEMIIDTRVNPGHWRFKQGYIEGVAAQMWLGDAFFDAVNLEKSALFDVPWLEATELDNGVVHIKAYDTEFNSDQGEQRAIQIKLRKLLFGQSLHTEDQTFTQLSEFGN
ncbi:hypothetical protein CWB73_02970 [Pseudoalteromonas phenolica]|uniref:Uncharacterized protein n=1 Tax=Pseudoalteromonas phenolica TaxID=161398 RepID=A0A5S3YXY3_9GAMM|nr:hypothetical protein [Pseudoalteromonas phenolica]TMP83178.1 hypothetical protein CWB73_02970 [Pseudoalteromonas phenolica]